jgi:hypothetical protein
MMQILVIQYVLRSAFLVSLKIQNSSLVYPVFQSNISYSQGYMIYGCVLESPEVLGTGAATVLNLGFMVVTIIDMHFYKNTYISK